MNTIITAFEEQVRLRPEAIAIRFHDQTLTYAELNEQANQLAHYLQAKGIKPDMAVALCMKRSPALFIAIFGILKAGGAYVPLDALHPEERLFFTLQDNNNPILLIQHDLKDKFQNYAGQIILPEENPVIAKQPTHNPEIPVKPEHLAYIMYTSGSTGKPKGVLIEHAGIVNYAHWFAEYCQCNPLDVIDFSANYIFDMSISVSIVPLLLGLTVHICDDDTKKNSRRYLQHLVKNKIKIIKITPGYLKLLIHELKQNPQALPYPQQIVLGGENLAKSECNTWLCLYPEHELFNEYGPTEASIAVSYQKICKDNITEMGLNIPIGKAGLNMHCYVLDSNNQIVPQGEQGELHIAGICLARGYLNQTELTAKRFIETTFCKRLYKTGDLCSIHSDGTIEYFGRMDDQIKIRGFRIELEEIAQCLLKHPSMDDVVIFAPEEASREKRLIAWYILKPNTSQPDPAELQLYLKKYLPEYMIPTAFVRMDAFPLTANNKLDKQAFPLPVQESSIAFRPPETDLEKILAALWSEELSLNVIGLDDDFFEAGGHSLSAARIISQINNTLHKDISLSDFYQAPTIARLTPLIHKAKHLDNKNACILDDSKPFALGNFQFLLWISTVFEPKARKLNIVSRKRVSGALNTEALQFAFQALLKKHEVLNYRIFRFQPAQILNKDIACTLEENNLQHLDDADKEYVLNTSFHTLAAATWSQHKPCIRAQLFQLDTDTHELHIALPHIISDEISLDIVWTDLSLFYQAWNTPSSFAELSTDKRFRNFVFHEQQYLQEFLERDITFWETWLRESTLCTFPKEQVMTHMKARDIPYSTYTKIPEQALKQLQQFCMKHQLNIHHCLCAALSQALFHLGDSEKNRNIFINTVKSTRNDPDYDDTIGCFLRLEPVRIIQDTQSSLLDLTHQIRKSVLETMPYQPCSSLVKLACVSIFQKKSRIKPFLTRLFTRLYSTLFHVSLCDRQIMTMAQRLSRKLGNDFLVNINIQNHFLTNKEAGKHLFGLDTIPLKTPQDDLLQIDNVFDVVFFTQEQDNTSWLVISANLKPDFRKAIAQEFIAIISRDAEEVYAQSDALWSRENEIAT